jgi:Rps23 Pro-64 3,4-dihydroxylase Tpa1-like proline 4-hydroxylase
MRAFLNELNHLQNMYLSHVPSIKALAKEFKSAKPYPYLECKKFFDEILMQEVKTALLKQAFEEKESDLFKFKQTADLKNTTNPVIKEFIAYLYSQNFIDFMQQVTGFTLTNQVDIAGTRYDDTDFLLCHDDELQGRKIAFLVYLSDMKISDGGALALYDVKQKLPNKVVKTIQPQFATFTFFEVNPFSFHEVQEVLSKNSRIAIGGWYHA